MAYVSKYWANIIEIFTTQFSTLVVIAEPGEDLIKRLNEWKNNVENRGVRVNMNKTKVV